MATDVEQLVAQLQDRIERLEAELRDAVDRLEHTTDPVAPHAVGRPPDDADVNEPVEPDIADSSVVRTDRRQLLTRAATLTAGAVAGGTALALGQASPAAAAAGVFDGNPAVTATASTLAGTGVLASSANGYAVRGNATATSGVGVFGNNPGSGVGVKGSSETGEGVMGGAVGTFGVGVRGVGHTAGVEGTTTDGYALRAIAGGNGTAHLVFWANSGLTPPPNVAVLRVEGEVIFDQNEDLWLCTQAGTPGVWRRLGGANTAGALTALATPVRVYDSRPGYLPNIGTKAPLDPAVARSCDLKANGSGVPAGATAVMVSVVATQTTGGAGGFLSLYRNGIAWPGTSNVNWSGPNQNVAVTTITAVSSTAICNLYASQSTHVVVDVLGYYR